MWQSRASVGIVAAVAGVMAWLWSGSYGLGIVIAALVAAAGWVTDYGRGG